MKRISLIIVLGIFLTLPIAGIFNFNVSIGKNEISLENNVDSRLKKAGFWNLTGAPIEIDDSDPTKNWSYTATTYDWCSGSGTWNDPYILENITIDGQNASICITIKNSKTSYFIVRNCHLYNSIRIAENTGALNIINASKGILKNNTCINNYDNGIYIQNCINLTIIQNNCSYNDFSRGIWGENCSHIKIMMNYLSNNANFGLDLHGLNWSRIEQNDFYENGLRFYHYSTPSVNNIIVNNTFFNTGGIVYTYSHNALIADNKMISQIAVSDAYNVSIISNTISRFQAASCYGINVTGNVIPKSNYNGIEMTECNDSIISDNNISHVNDAGVYTWRCINLTIEKNNIEYGRYGINIQDAGAMPPISTNNKISCNMVRHNMYGIVIGTAFDNFIWENFMVNNSNFNARSMTRNYWNNSIIGNFYDDYLGTDDNGDGIGDTPYLILGEGNNIDYLPIWDQQPPNITIISPQKNELFGKKAPSFEVEISDRFLETMWYSLDNGQTNITFTSNETIKQSLWEPFGNETVIIKFFARDFPGNIEVAAVQVKKDIIKPIVIINEVIVRVVNPPLFNISVIEPNLESMWYTFDGGLTNTSFYNFIDTINESVWDATPNGFLTLRFYAKDKVDNEGYNEITIFKEIRNVHVDIVHHEYSLNYFNITFFIYNETNDGIDFASIQIWWNETDVSGDVQNLGNGLYFISLEPITVAPGEDPILLKMTITAPGYEDKNFETYIAVDSDTFQKVKEKPSEELPIALIITISVGNAGAIIGVAGIFLYRRRKREL